MIESESEYKSVKYRYLKPWNTFSFSSLGTPSLSPQPSLSILLSQGFDLGLFD